MEKLEKDFIKKLTQENQNGLLKLPLADWVQPLWSLTARQALNISGHKDLVEP